MVFWQNQLKEIKLDFTENLENCDYLYEFNNGKFHGQGTYTFATGDKYVGEWKDEKYHGQGTYTFVDGRKETGYYMDGNFLPDICEGMGLSKGTSEFGKCVLKLIDKL